MSPRYLLTVPCVVAVMAVAPRLVAEPNSIDRAAARSLFDEGRKLAREGKYAEACPKLEESQRLDAGTGTLFNLADCYEHVGRLASAWSDFLEVADAAKRANDAEREKVARGRAQKLEGKLARLAFVRAASGQVEIKLDDRILGEGALGAGLPVDKGPHAVQVSAPGKKAWSTSIEATDGATTTVTIPELADEVVAPPPPPPPPALPPPAPAPPEERSWQRPLGLIVGSVGVVGIGVGAFFGLRAKSQWSDAQPHCPSAGCDPQGYSSWSDAHGSATASTIAFAAGGALVAGGVVLFLTAPSSPAAPRVGVAGNRVTLDVEF